jgi:hypothetical protein
MNSTKLFGGNRHALPAVQPAMRVGLMLIALAAFAHADSIVSPQPTALVLRHDPRPQRRAGAALLGFGLALTIAGAALLGTTLYRADHSPPSDSAGPAVNDLGLASGSAFALQSGLAVATTGALLLGVRF